MKVKTIVKAVAVAALAAGYAHAGSDKCGAGEKAACTQAERAACTQAGKEACTQAQKTTSSAVQKVDTTGVKKLLASGEKVTVLDARSGKWDDGKRIAGAKALNAGMSDEELTKALPDKDAKILTYCGGVKCPASGALADKLAKLGYKNVTEYPEGIEGWVKAGNEVQKAN